MAIASLGDRTLAGALAQGLDASWRVDRIAAAESLGDLGGPEAASALRASLGNERDETLRRVLWRGALRADEASTRRALESADDAAARWVALELGVRSGRFVRTRGVREACARQDASACALACALGECADASAALRETNAVARAQAAWALSFADTSRVSAAPLLRAYESEQDPDARATMALALARWPGQPVTDALERTLAGPAEVVTIERVIVADCLARRLSTAPRRWLPAMLDDRRAAVRASALWIALRTQDPVGLATARRLAVEDVAPEVRGSAREVIDSSRWPTAGGGVERGSFAGGAALHAAGLAPSAPWAVWLPEGHVVMAMSASDGTLLVPNVPSATFDLESLQR
jgi:hypothetical protein